MTVSRQPTLDALRRLLAAGSAALVFALGLMSVSPALHQWVHHESCDSNAAHTDHGDDSQPLNADHGCAVVWFAHGLTVAADAVTPERAPEIYPAAVFHAVDAPRRVSADHRLPSGRAPPQV